MVNQQRKSQPTIVVTTGGSGGHIFPAEAIAGSLVRQGAKVVFMTDRRGEAFQGLKQVQVYRLMAESVTGRSLLGKFLALFKLYIGAVQALYYLRFQIKPDAVVGVGGYASIPAVIVAHLLKIPVILHEQNAVLGRANRLLARGSKFIGTTFSPTLRVPKDIPQIQVGLPVRAAIEAYRKTPYPVLKGVFHLFIFGGSQGARFFSRKLPEVLLKLPIEMRRKIDLVQQVRPEDMETVRAIYDQAGFKKMTLKSFFNDMPDQLKKAHLVIGRGGAGTLTELMVIGRPAIIVPLPTAADNHQEENARQFCDQGAGWMFLEQDFQADTWAQRLEKLIRNEEVLSESAERAAGLSLEYSAEKMAGAVLDVVKGSKS